ncbi:high-affinity iron permease [Entophlyctis sp. JEL0112]|nr:high-affinity iron permease [Entophlyctis sp. JEL0112]
MREALEAAVVVSVLSSFVHQSFPKGTFLFKRMYRLILTGTLLAISISVVIGAAFLVVWFKYATNLWASAELLWEGIEGLVAGVMLTFLAFGFLQSEELTEKWHKKLRKTFLEQLEPHQQLQHQSHGIDNENSDDSDSIASKASLEDRIFTAFYNFWKKKTPHPAHSALPSSEQPAADASAAELPVEDDVDKDKPLLNSKNTSGYTLFILPFLTVLREGLECVVFIGGIGVSSDPGTIPLAAVVGLGCGALLGYIIFKLGNSLKARNFFLGATIFILILAVGLTTTSISKIESYRFKQMIGTNVDLTESLVHNVNTTVWYLNCCNPEEEVRNNYGWQVFAAVLGWNNFATYLTIGVYVGFCLVVAAVLVLLKYRRVRRLMAKRERKAARAALSAESAAQQKALLAGGTSSGLAGGAAVDAHEIADAPGETGFLSVHE